VANGPNIFQMLVVFVNRRNNEAWDRGPTLQGGHAASLFRRFTDTDVYGTGSVKIRKTRHEIYLDIRIFLQCVGVTERHDDNFSNV